MGHICGLLDRDYSDSWWSEPELVKVSKFLVVRSWTNRVKLEKGTKRRRNGKLAPLAPELASDEYMQRTHSLLSNWEDGGSTSAASSAVPSPAAQSSGRMTLRERQKAPAEHYSQTYELGSPIKRSGRQAAASRERATVMKEDAPPAIDPPKNPWVGVSRIGPQGSAESPPTLHVTPQAHSWPAPGNHESLPLGATEVPQDHVSTPQPEAAAPAPTANAPRIILKFSRPPQETPPS